MYKDKKGFTLVEILAAVTILGILSIIAVVSVNNVIQKSKENYYKSAEDNLELAGQSYVQQNRSALPKAVGQKVKIPLKILVEKNYIEPIDDYSDNECDLNNSYVQIFKYSQNDYSYLAYLDCPVYDSKEQLEKGAPDVYVVLTNPGSSKKAKANIRVEDSEKLLSWSYIVYRDGKEVLNSGSMMLPNYDKKAEKSIDISKYTPGKIKVVVTATNIYGLTTKKTSEVLEYKDESAPICIIKDVDKKENPKPWTQESKTVTVGCDDGDGTGCTREEYSVTFKQTTDVGEITIEDESGNKTICEVSVNVDVTAPECTVDLSGTKGDNGWYKSKNVEITLTRKDNHSGVASYDLTTSSTASYNGKYSGVQSDIADVTWYGYIKDNVGNVAKCNSGKFKVDATKPECTVSKSGTTGNNGWYKENNVSLTLNPTDNLSGIAQTGLSTQATPTLGSTKTGTQGNTSSVTWYGRVKDNAGNISDVCNSGAFKVDTTKPTCSVSFSGTAGNSGWYKSNATVSLSTSDSLSNVEKYGLTTSTSATYNNSASSTQSDTASQSWNGYVMDYAGNTNSCNNSVKVDTQKPSCTVTLSGTSGSNGWYKSSVSVSLNSSDNGPSGVSKTGLSTSSTPTLGSTTSASQGNTAGVTYYGRVQDAAGNISDTCSSGSFKIDSSSPSCSISVSTSGVSLSASDSGSSGVASSGINGGGNSASLGTGTFNGSVTDRAGNTASCSKRVFSTSYYYSCSSGSVSGSSCYSYPSASCKTVDTGSCTCRDPDGSSPGYHPAICISGSCSCPGGLVVRTNDCGTRTECTCSSGTLTSGNKCQVYIGSASKVYYCDSGTKLNNSYCYS